MNHGSSRLKSKFGFTIVELLVVIVVIGILAAITIVSYSGITNRAIIASIQSDLSNASTLLKMDQITTESFPTTLALANSGKGITSSQTMDSVIYIPDNTSNPKTFCLQYKKGTNTYAVDNNSTPSKGVCLQNLISNGDFRNGATGWAMSGGNFSVTAEVMTSLAIVHYGYPKQSLSLPANFRGHEIYSSCSIKSDSNQADFVINDGVGETHALHTGSNVYERLSVVRTINANASQVMFGTYDDRVSGWTNIYYMNWIAIDLTATFGAGNEPTKAQMDTIMSNYPNSWFNIVAKANL